MAITITVPQVLRQYTGRKSVKVEGTTVRDCLKNFAIRYPDTEKWIFSGSGSPMICVFLNKEAVLPGNLDRAVAEGDVLDLISVVAGG